MDEVSKGQQTKPLVRVLIMLIGTLTILLISWKYTGSPLPQDEEYSIIFQNALLLIVLGSAILEPFFTKPADSMVNSLMALMTMFGVYHVSPLMAWWAVFSYCLFVFVISTLCVSTAGHQNQNSFSTVINRYFYRPAIVFGRARIVFSIIFLFGIYSFYSIQSELTVSLIIFWGIFMAIWPLRLPQVFSSFIDSQVKEKSKPVGRLIRVDNPGLFRFEINSNSPWERGRSYVYQRIDGSQSWVLPLYSHYNDEKRIGTAIFLGENKQSISSLIDGNVYESSTEQSNAELMALLGEDSNTKLIGFVSEDSSIGRIRFELQSGSPCADGMLVWCRVQAEKVYYQVSAGITFEEGLEGDKHGYQIAQATQLGTQDEDGFHKYDWLPNMNSPVFTLVQDVQVEENAIPVTEFKYGNLPKTNIPVTGNFVDNFNFHTAVIGVTGSGKTELAFDLIRHAVGNQIKVICIDLTSQYQGRLEDLEPIDLSIDTALSAQLGAKLFDVETGNYGAGAEKKALQEFSDDLRQQVDQRVRAFINSDSHLGLIQLPEISNSQASIYITEIYMSCLLNLAKENYGNFNKTLVAVEEAHTIMPETATMGVSDFASKSLVARIAQIALQGRKYNVGLLVLAQRTANVSKTVLTQCNSIISFACYDDTSISFLKNVFGSGTAEMVPNLKNLQAVVFGKIVKSERPVVVDIPFDQSKQ